VVRLARTSWFTEARFGLFVHWGLYALPARHEWAKKFEAIDEETYQRYFEHFRADRYDPRRWAADARAAGMRYAVLTTKHHEGFCLWDSALTDYKATNTPAGRDLVSEFVDAFRAEGLRVGFYHSLLDWHHPDVTIDEHHPRWRDDVPYEELNAGREMERYVDYLHGQVRELLAYDPDVMWFDFSYSDDPRVRHGKGAKEWRAEELVAMVRAHNPDILLNDRLELPSTADFRTPEEYAPESVSTLPWEACRTLNGSWGYAPGYQQWLDAGQVVRLLVDGISKGGNLLLNVGPTARGEFEPRARALLAEVGEWTGVHGAAVYGAGPAPEFTAPPDCRLTRAGDRLFVHVFAWPAGHLAIDDLAGRIAFASFLHDGAEIPVTRLDEAAVTPAARQFDAPPTAVVLHLPVRRPDVLVPVIEIVLSRGHAA
jgi:alpha-L-fucosidase